MHQTPVLAFVQLAPLVAGTHLMLLSLDVGVQVTTHEPTAALPVTTMAAL